MKKIILIVIVVIIIGVGGFYILQGHFTVSPSVSPSSSNTNTPLPVENNPPTGGNQNQITGQVNIENFSFNPSPLNIKVGTTVIWTNKDSVPHKVKSDNNTFESGNLTKGSSFPFTFSAAGIFDYICAIHTSMKGKIIVTQ